MIRGPLSAEVVGARPAVQVGVFALPANAQAVLARLQAAGFDARVDRQSESVHRVLALGRGEESSEALSRSLASAGWAQQKPLAGDGGRVAITGEGGEQLIGARIEVIPVDPDPVRVGGKLVRGLLVLRPSTDGVAVIDVVNLEAYLRGVVPAEMGPRAFPELEALKAQAVAARTYAVAHLGDHDADGYDLCDTQSCQVYEGVDAEQALSDRAVRETAGEVAAFEGRPIDAMYHSTCAGHTEDGANVFPDRAAPYLKGVPCRGDRTLAGGVSTAGPWLGEIERLAAVGAAIARSLGVPAKPRSLAARLSGAQPDPGLPGLERCFGLERTAKAIRVAPGGTPEDVALDVLRLFRVPLPPPPRAGGRSAWEMAATVRFAQLAGAVQAVSGRLVPGPSGARLVAEGVESPKDLTGREILLERRGDRWRLNTMRFPAGSVATLWCVAEACPLVEVEALEDADGGSAWTWWWREASLEDISRKLSIPGVREVAVTRRGVSGRALSVAVVGSQGKREVGGLAFRRAVELPDTLFDVEPVRNAKNPSVRFLGRGWGHGVGMCQNGAYGLARGGTGYVEILKKYYTGVELAHWGGETHEHNSSAGTRDP
jgi:stage II sporulation protein D